MTLQEAAKYLGIHQVTLYRLIRESDIPAIRLRGQWRFKKDHLDAWLLRRTARTGATAEVPVTRMHELPGTVIEQMLPVLRELFVWTQPVPAD
jgi:excisionase family DNA binding protein